MNTLKYQVGPPLHVYSVRECFGFSPHSAFAASYQDPVADLHLQPPANTTISTELLICRRHVPLPCCGGLGSRRISVARRREAPARPLPACGSCLPTPPPPTVVVIAPAPTWPTPTWPNRPSRGHPPPTSLPPRPPP